MAEVGRRRSITGLRVRRITDEEHELMTNLRQSGQTYEVIGVILGRSAMAVYSHLNPLFAQAQRRIKLAHYYRKHSENLASRALYRLEHMEEAAARLAAWQQRNPEKVCQSARRYRERHPDRVRTLAQRYQHSDEGRAHRLAWYHRNKTRLGPARRERARAYHWANREAILERKAERRRNGNSSV